MIYVQAPQMTLLQKVVLFIVLAAFLVGAFFLTMAFLPVIIVFIIYLYYKFYKFKKRVQEAQENLYNSAEYQGEYTNFQNNYLHSEQFNEEQSEYKPKNEDVYDISPDDYTIEDKK